MALLATLHDHRRLSERQEVDAGATLRIGSKPLDALVANISASGCLFVCSHDLAVGDVVSIGIAGLGRRDVRIVRASGSRFGAEFVAPLGEAEIAAALSSPVETVVAFPIPLEGPALTEDLAVATPTVAPALRLAIVAGLAMSTWAGAVAVVHLIH